MIVFYEKEYNLQYQRFLQSFEVAASLVFPIDEMQLKSALMALQA